jgi:NTE family protein
MNVVQKKGICILIILLAVSQIVKSDGKETKAESARPKIGLVLSGGGAKGLAHIGVLKVLEESGLKVDYITGVSMGSIVGALYSIGYSATEIENIANTLKWNELLYDEVSRNNISIEEKDEDGRYVGQLMMVNGKLMLPKGFVKGNKIASVLSSLTWPVHQISDFSEFPIPFKCIATDIVTIEPVVLDQGYLPDALRASMAIPAYFSPVEIDGRMLVDGGVFRNFPVEEVIDMGADIVIGVNVTSGLHAKDDLTSVFEILGQSTTYQITQAIEDQKKYCDVLIEPELSNFNMFSFGNTDSIIMAGEAMAKGYAGIFKKIADSLNTIYSRPVRASKEARLHKGSSIYIDRLRIEGLEEMPENVITNNLHLDVPSEIDLEEIEDGIEKIYGTRFFESVYYKFDFSGDQNVLVVKVQEQPYNFFKFSFNYNNYLKSALLLNSTFRNALGKGSRLLAEVRLSENPAFRAHYQINTLWKPAIGYTSQFVYNNFKAYNVDNSGYLANISNYRHTCFETGLQSVLTNSLMIQTLLQFDHQNIASTLSGPDSLKNRMAYLNATARLLFDTYDYSVFPKSGKRFRLELSKNLGTTNPDNTIWRGDFVRAKFLANKIFPFGNKIFLDVGLGSGITMGENPHPINYFHFGGESRYEPTMLSFAGLRFMRATSPNFWNASSEITIEPWKNKYILLKGSVAKLADTYEGLWSYQQLLAGIEAGVGFKSFIGPVTLTIGTNNKLNNVSAFLNIGYIF